MDPSTLTNPGPCAGTHPPWTPEGGEELRFPPAASYAARRFQGPVTVDGNCLQRGDPGRTLPARRTRIMKFSSGLRVSLLLLSGVVAGAGCDPSKPELEKTRQQL